MQQFESDSFLESDEARTQHWVQIVANPHGRTLEFKINVQGPINIQSG